MVFWTVCLCAYASPSTVLLVEICDNAIDDDGDGFIDLQDPDCECPVLEPVSLIPNPSFEDSQCCPQDRSSLHCADTWIQASEATTDYLHECGWFGWENLPPPLPIPHGQACIGFRNGRFGGDNPNPNWKEYTGACLTSPLKAGNEYRLQFWLGFTNPRNSPPLSVVMFGSTDCKNLPFGVGDQRFGCPTNGPGWVQLTHTFAGGGNNWVQREFNIKPTQDIYAIAIGPNCTELNATDNPYYFLDDLVLADVKEFEFVIQTDDHPCADKVTLRLPERDSLTFQWYRDGIALIGETGHQLEVRGQEGIYQVLLRGKETCKVTRPYHHTVPRPVTVLQDYLCQGREYAFFDRQLAAGGDYSYTLKTADNCDSTIRLTLREVRDSLWHQAVKIFEGESYQVGHRDFTRPTSEQILLSSSLGCDSTIQLDLSYYHVFVPNVFTPDGDGLNDHFTVFGNHELLGIEFLRIFDRWGTQVFEGFDLDPNKPEEGWNGSNDGRRLDAGTYVYVLGLKMDDGETHLVTGDLALFR